MGKHNRIEDYITSLKLPQCSGFDRCYLAYFRCFNACDYYEAHDVLEHLWLQCRDSDYNFYKALIQFAGAFVHLKKQRARPQHPTDGKRLQPAVRLLRLALKNFEAYPTPHHGLDLAAVRAIADGLIAQIEGAEYKLNPWSEATAPYLSLGSLPPPTRCSQAS